MTLTPAQLEKRRTGITATDAAALSGAHPYRKPIDVYLEKIGVGRVFNGNDRTKWGNLLEGPIRDDYAERRGLVVEVPGTLTHPTIPWALATPDGICYQPRRAHPEHGLEIKTHSYRVQHLYGDPGTDQAPPYVLIQCAWNMHVSGLDAWDLVAFIDGQPQDYRIRRDDELIGTLAEISERFLVDNVRARKPPEPDGSDSFDAYMSTAFPQDRAPCLSIDDDPVALARVRLLRDAREQAGQTKDEIEILTQHLKLACGNNVGIEWTELEDGKSRIQRIMYKRAKDGSAVDYARAWEDAARCAQRALQEGDDGRGALQHIAAARLDPYTTTKPGSRRFTVPRSWSNDAKES